MKRKIRASLMALSVLCVLIAALVLTFIFYRFYENQMCAVVKNEAEILTSIVALSEDPADALHTFGLTKRDDRVTFIDADGRVLFDSYEPAENLGNHLNREEVMGALSSGQASSNRYSATLGKQTYYYAVKTEDGQILRAAKTMDGMLKIFLTILWPCALVVLAVSLIAYIFAGRVTAGIVAPINGIDLAGEDRPVYEELSPLLKRITHQNEKIGEQMRLLKNRADTIQAIIGDMREGLIILSEKGDIVSANASALTFFGASAAPGSLIELTRDKDIVECARRAIRGSNCDCVFESDGRVVQAYFSPVRHEHGDGAILFFLDISERVNAEKIRREFSANVSHELKTPLTVIAGLSEMLCEGMARDEDAIPFAEKIRAESQRLQTLINDIIKLSALDEGGEMDKEAFDLCALAEDALSALKPLSDEKGIQASVEGENVVIFAQRGRIYELLFNLIDNGIKYNRNGGELTVSVQKEGERTRISVRDTGIGIPKDKLTRVFERFYRVDSSRSKQTGGTGLGLSIVKHIALIHGGSVEIVSEEGKYTEVRVMM